MAFSEPKIVRASMASDGTQANGASYIFVKDLLTGALTRIAEDPSSDGLSLSADGLHVGFHSNVPTLVSGDTNNRWDVFVAGLTGV